jgi:hypothetical protein
MTVGVFDVFPGEMASGEGLKPDRRDASKKLPGWSEEGLLKEWDNVDELLDVFRRSWLWPVLNCTSRGDDGCELRLGEEPVPLMDGEAGRPPARLVESVRFNGPGTIGLVSSDGDGDVTVGEWIAGPGLFWGSIASARSF